jgi:prevent-host-death family protein
MDRQVGAYEAKTRLPELLRDVARGERITITVRGRPVAELVPTQQGKPSAAEAVQAMKSFARVKGVDADDLANWIAEGRR